MAARLLLGQHGKVKLSYALGAPLGWLARVGTVLYGGVRVSKTGSGGYRVARFVSVRQSRFEG